MSSSDRHVRGRTRPGRLAALDAWLVHEARPLLEGASLVIDVGFGDSVVTIEAFATAVHSVNPRTRVLGLERLSSRVPSSAVGCELRQGDFTTLEALAAEPPESPPVHPDPERSRRVEGSAVSGEMINDSPTRSSIHEALTSRELSSAPSTSSGRTEAGEFLSPVSGASVVRAINVLRGYREEELPGIHRALLAPLAPGGLLIEGTTDLDGHVTGVHLLRRGAGRAEDLGLLLHTDFERGFSPWLFRDVLPRDLRRAARPGTPVHQALTRWSDAVDALGAGLEPRQRFLGALTGLSFLEATTWEAANGYVRLRLSSLD